MRRLSGFAVVHHRGRRTNLPFTTPVNIFDTDRGAAIVALTYGPGADWVRNVLAGGGEIERRGVTRSITSAELVGREDAWPWLPRVVRTALYILTVRDFLLITMAD